MLLLRCVIAEGVYVDTSGKMTKNVVIQWGETPTSVAYIASSGQLLGWGLRAIEVRSAATGHLDGVFMHKREQRFKFLCERNDKVIQVALLSQYGLSRDPVLSSICFLLGILFKHSIRFSPSFHDDLERYSLVRCASPYLIPRSVPSQSELKVLSSADIFLLLLSPQSRSVLFSFFYLSCLISKFIPPHHGHKIVPLRM